MSPGKISTFCTYKAVQVITKEWWNVSFRPQSKHTHTDDILENISLQIYS